MLLLFSLGVFYEYSRLLPAKLEQRLGGSSPGGRHKATRSVDGIGSGGTGSNAPLLGGAERERSSTPLGFYG